MNKYRLQVTVFVLVAFMLGCNEFMVVGVLSDIARQFSVSIATVGYLVTVFATVYAVSTPFITVYTSQYNRFKTLMVLMAVFLIGNTFSGFAPNYLSLIVSRVITASVSGAIISLIMTFASTIAPRNKRAGLVSWIYSGFSIASVIGVPIGTTISTSYGWRYTFIIISVVSIITYALLFWLLPHTVPQVKSTMIKQLTLMKDSRIYVSIVLVLLSAATLYSYYTYIRPLLTDSLGFGIHNLNWLLFLIGIMNIVGNQLSGRLADHQGLKAIPLIYISVAILLFVFPFTLTLKWLGLIILMVLSTMNTLLSAPLQIHFLSVAERDYPQSLVLASSLSSIFFNFGISLGSATASASVDFTGVGKLAYISALYALGTLVFALLLNLVIKRHMARRTSHE